MNAFTSKPDLKHWAQEQKANRNRSNEATKNVTKNPTRYIFSINPDDPRYNPLATQKEKDAWKQKKLAKHGKASQ
jgi:hypothetical protein